jgi:hypothetical protein
MTDRTAAIRRNGIGFVLAATVMSTVLGGCSRSEPEAPPVTDNMSYEEDAPVETAAPVAPVAEAAPPAEVKAEAPPAPEIAPDVQVQDDADATGMTARVTRDGAAKDAPSDDAADAPTTNETKPE